MKYLGEYAQTHFRHEEELMTEKGCPICPVNCNAHARFLSAYKQLMSDFAVDQDPDQIATEIERVAACWLRLHLLAGGFESYPAKPGMGQTFWTR